MATHAPDGYPDTLMPDEALASVNRAASFTSAVVSAAETVKLPSSVVFALGVAAEVVTVARTGHGQVTPEVEALRLALLPILDRAKAIKAAA